MINQFLQQALQRFQLLIVAFGCIIGVILSPESSLADEEPPFDEVTIFVNVSGLGGKELEALIQAEQAYLSVTELFQFLKIKNKLSTDQDSVSGFFLSQSQPYVIDNVNNRIILADKTFPLNPDHLISTLTGLYLRSDIFGKVFELNWDFNHF